MDNNLNPKKEENIEKNEEYYIKEFRKVNIAFFLSITRIVLYIICLFTIFSNSVLGVTVNIFSAYFIWIITIVVNKLLGVTIEHRFRIFEFKYFLWIFFLFVLKIFF